MPNYQQGKIYKITGGNLTYYGSTCVKYLSKRLCQHISQKKAYDNKKTLNITKSYEILNFPDYCISLVENFPCNSKDELIARERWYIENNECVNKYIPGRTTKEWYNDNKIEHNESTKKYYELNKSKILIQQSKFRQDNPEIIYERKKKYREQNNEKIKEEKKRYYEANKERLKEKFKLNYQKRKVIANQAQISSGTAF